MPIRGGIPLCFPQFADRGPLPQHGFVRDRDWAPLFAGRTPGGAAQVRMRLADTDDTRAMWPHPFACELTATAQGSALTVELAFTNTGAAPFDVTAALHTYLRVRDVRATAIEGLSGARYRDKRLGEDGLLESAPSLLLAQPLDRVYYT